MFRFRALLPGALVALALLLTACGSSGGSTDAGSDGDDPATAAGVRLVSTDEAAEIHDNPAADLVVLDVRTAEEFAAGHLEGATMIDFYREDFAEQVAQLDRDTPYLLYCRSGNRSGQTRQLMSELGFGDVADMNGGITAWAGDGHPVVTG